MKKIIATSNSLNALLNIKQHIAGYKYKLILDSEATKTVVTVDGVEVKSLSELLSVLAGSNKYYRSF